MEEILHQEGTSWYGKWTIIYKVLYIERWLAGFLPSTVSPSSNQLEFQPSTDSTHLNHTADLLVATDDGIQLAPFGVRNEVPAILIEGLVGWAVLYASERDCRVFVVPSLFSGVLLNGMRHVGGLRMVKEQDWGLDIESAPPLYFSGFKTWRHSSQSHHSESTTKHHHESHRSQFYYNDGWRFKSIAGNKMVFNFHSCWPCYLNLFLSTTLKGPRQEPCKPIQTFLL